MPPQKSTSQKIKLVEVKNLADLHKALEPFNPASNTTIRKTLIDGFDVIKKHITFEQQQANHINQALATSPDKFIRQSHIRPSNSPGYNVDLLIRDRLNGKREGLKITWKLPEGTYEYDPYNGKLNKL